MNTTYIRFLSAHEDPVWGCQALAGFDSGLVRVTRNRLRKAVFEFVGFPALKFDLADVKRRWPVVMFAEIENSGSDFHSLVHKVSPLPKDRKVKS